MVEYRYSDLVIGGLLVGNMVEKVAQAIRAADVENGSETTNPSYYRRLACAAIAALRDPTEDMVVAGADCDPESGCVGTWQTMVDAALKA